MDSIIKSLEQLEREVESRELHFLRYLIQMAEHEARNHADTYRAEGANSAQILLFPRHTSQIPSKPITPWMFPAYKL